MPTEHRKNHEGRPSSREGQGRLFLIGGNEDKIDGMEILRTLSAEAGGAHARIEVITTASSEPKRVWRAYKRAFKEIGVGYAEQMHIASRTDAEAPELLDRLAKSTAIFFTGGDQLRLTSILGATPVAQAIRYDYLAGGKLIAGTSAGAAALSTTIIYDGESPEALRKGAVMMTGGLALIANVVIDTHFMTRGRIGRLIQAVAGNPRLIGIGLGEDTGILLGDGAQFRVVGSGLVMVVDGAGIGFTDVFDVEPMETFSVEDVRVHVLSAGAGYDLGARAFKPPLPRGPTLKSEGKESLEGP